MHKFIDTRKRECVQVVGANMIAWNFGTTLGEGVDHFLCVDWEMTLLFVDKRRPFSWWSVWSLDVTPDFLSKQSIQWRHTVQHDYYYFDKDRSRAFLCNMLR